VARPQGEVAGLGAVAIRRSSPDTGWRRALAQGDLRFGHRRRAAQ